MKHWDSNLAAASVSVRARPRSSVLVRGATTHWALILAGLALAAAAIAKDAPVELDEQRTPALQTKGNCLIRGGTLLTGSQGTIEGGSILVRGGKIAEIGKDLKAPDGVPIIEAAGKFVTPGIIDAHSHIAADAINEGSDNITAEVRIQDVLNPQSLSIYRGLAGGVTATLILHGSANVIGGQSAVVKMKWRRTADEMLVPDAPRIIKFALGENPKRSNSTGGGGQNTAVRFPQTRMGVEAVIRRGFDEARRYQQSWKAWDSDKRGAPPRRDLRLETLSDILQGKIWVHCHAYRTDEMLMLLRLAKEYGFKLAAFQHALEAYRIAPEIAAAGVGISTFADNWAYKIEAWEAIPYNAAMCRKAGIISSINSDDAERMRRLNLDAAKSIKFGGLEPDEALRLVTLYPAQQLGIAQRTGSLEVGKDADIAIWEGHPLSVYSRCVTTLIEGEVFFQRRDAFDLNRTAVAAREVSACRVDHPTLRPPPPARIYAITGGTVHPVSSPPILNGVVIIEEGSIRTVGTGIPVPKDARVVDARGLHVYPGLIDAGSQLGLTEIASIRATRDAAENGDFQPDLTALTAVHAASEHFAVTRFDGVTTALTRPSGSMISGQSAVINLAGWTPDEMAVRSPAALHVEFPERQPNRFGFFGRLGAQAAAPPAASRTQRLREFFERARSYSRSQAGTRADPRLEAMVPYVTGKRPVVFQADTERGIRDALKFAEEFGVKPIIGGGREAWRAAETLSEKKVPVIYGSIYALPSRDYDPYDVSYAAPAVLHQAGVKLAFESADAPLAKELPHQVGIACGYGLPAEAGLRAVTLGAAEILGVSTELGSLEPGKLGNVIVTDGDPLEHTTSLHYLFIAGKPVALESKHTRSYLTYRQRLPESAAGGNARAHGK